MIIGLTGTNAAGKTTVADILKDRNYLYFSLSDVIRDEAKKRNLEFTRENLQKLGNELRKTHGVRYLAKKINEKIEKEQKKGQKDFVIDSIRNPNEVFELKKNKDFLLLGVDAPTGLRFARAKKRGRLENADTLEEFEEQEEKENSKNPKAQQLKKVYKMADRYVYNDESLDELKKRLDFALSYERKKRPDWDTYFMQICDLVKTRAACLRRQVGAVIVKNNQIISTGYNGPPKHHPHCDALGGCLRDLLNVPSGQRHEISRAAHAEQNAIAQAAANGISTKGAVMYCTTLPCSICMRIIIDADIKKIVYKEFYNDVNSLEIARRANIELVHFQRKKFV